MIDFTRAGMKILSKSVSLVTALGYAVIILNIVSCQFSTKTEQGVSRQAIKGIDTVAVTKYSVRGEVSSALSNWQSFVINDEIIYTPQGWKLRNKNGSTVIVPSEDEISNEKITFDRYNQDSPNLDYDKFIVNLYNKVFNKYQISKVDRIKKLELENGFAYERNIELKINNEPYRGYFLVYSKGSLLYEYVIIINYKRINDYNGNLFQDLIGNLTVKGENIFGENNKIKEIIYL